MGENLPAGLGLEKKGGGPMKPVISTIVAVLFATILSESSAFAAMIHVPAD